MNAFFWVKKQAHSLARILEYVGWFIILLWVVLMFVGTILRYFFRSPLIFQTDVIAVALVVFCSFCFPAVFISGDHIKVELFTRLLPKKMQTIFLFASEVIFILFSISIVYSSFGIISHALAVGSRMDVSNIPVLPFLLCIPIGFSLLALVILIDFCERLFCFSATDESKNYHAYS
jgi:TRAP-type C4-dicarboxylate transport system permease small subunit